MYGWRGSPNTSGAGPCSATWPRYITATACAIDCDDRKVVGDEQVGEPQALLELVQQDEDAGLHRDVERRCRLVEHDQLRVERQRPGDGDALALAAAELVRPPPQVLGAQADHLEQRQDAVFELGARSILALARSGSATRSCTVMRGFSDE